jgi:hypothetical protein
MSEEEYYTISVDGVILSGAEVQSRLDRAAIVVPLIERENARMAGLIEGLQENAKTWMAECRAARAEAERLKAGNVRLAAERDYCRKQWLNTLMGLLGHVRPQSSIGVIRTDAEIGVEQQLSMFRHENGTGGET